MGRAEKGELYKQQERLTPDDFEGEAEVLTIRRARRVVKKDGTGVSVVVEFEETHKVWWPNATSFGYLLDAGFSPDYKDDTGEFEQWAGQKVPLVVHETTEGNFAGSVTLWAASPETWQTYGLASAKQAPKPGGLRKRETAKVRGKPVRGLRKPVRGRGRK